MFQLKFAAALVFIYLAAALAFAALSQDTKYGPEFWDNLPPMSPADREAFDRAAKSIYRTECDCYTFIMKGKVRTLKRPLTNEQRWLLKDAIERGAAIPLSPQGDGA